jgi:RHH-type transcriptional regulator, rel operon repressor / antitoxin RelB
MIALRLPKDVEDRLEMLAKRAGQTKSGFVRAAILQLMEDMEDVAVAEARLRDLGQTVSWEDVKADVFGSENPAAAA